MSLQDILDFDSRKTLEKRGLSEERMLAQVPAFRNVVAFWREYPDLFVDFIKGPDSTFNLFFYQRIFLRIVLRTRYVYAVFPRAYSKSFLSLLALMIRCVLFPGSHLFISTGGKEQSAAIVRSKVEEICRLIPALHNEINWTPGKSTASKDAVRYTFKNGSIIQNVAANERSRGLRFHAGLLEECVSIDPTILNEVLIPLMNVSRNVNGQFKPEEILNKSQIYVTTAGWKNTFAYEKLIQILVNQIINPKEAMILGGSWRVPVMEKLLDKNFVRDLKLDGTFNEASFAREYESEWSGDAENAFFSSDKFDKHRTLNQPEYEYSNRSSKNAYYLLGIDVGRIQCTTEVMVIKVTPQPQGSALKTLVNLYTFDAEHFEDQAIFIKRLFAKYKCRVAIVDANGLGIGLVDYLVKDQIDNDGTLLANFGVENDDDYDNMYKKYKTSDTIADALFILKPNAPINTEAHTYVQTQMSSGKIKFLIEEGQAKVKLMGTKVGQGMNTDKRADYLKPFMLTSILKEQMLNLVEENEGINIILKQSNRGIKKDKFSAFEYGLYYVKLQEDRAKKKKTRNIADMMFFTSK